MKTTTPFSLALPRTPRGALHAHDELDLGLYFAGSLPLVPGSSAYAPEAGEDSLIAYADARARLVRVHEVLTRLSPEDFDVLERHYSAFARPVRLVRPSDLRATEALEIARENYVRAKSAPPIRR